jgi:glycosyltransferase involved in cell wall biosynthesis
VRVALVSPFPVVQHGSDASVTMLPELVRRLSHHIDLHVIAPPPARGEEIANIGQATYVPLDSSNPGAVRDRLGRRPYWQASVWNRNTERSVSLHLKRIAPDLLHGEYLQVGGSTACAPCPALLTLHDVSTDVMKRSLIDSTVAASPYRLAEYLRTYAFERRVVSRTPLPVTLSAADCARMRRWNAAAVAIAPAHAIPREAWAIDCGRPPVVVFAGAMWRNANVASARFLVHNVLPALRREIADAELRIVGARPTSEVQSWHTRPGVRVVGAVPSIEVEMLRSAAVIAPSIYGGGILVKALTAIVLGCPTVVSPTVAQSLELSRAEVAIASTGQEFANALAFLIRDTSAAMALGFQARTFASERFSWDARIESYLRCYEGLSR